MTEDAELRDKQLKLSIDRFLNHSIYGDIINGSIGMLSIVSCLAFVYMTGTDWSTVDSCCRVRETPGAEPVCPASCDPSECVVACDEFYYSRMPKLYEMRMSCN